MSWSVAATRFSRNCFNPGTQKAMSALTWKSLERSAKAVLGGFVRNGEIDGFRVRCDEETCQGGTPVVEVQLLSARRVTEVRFRVAPR